MVGFELIADCLYELVINTVTACHWLRQSIRPFLSVYGR